MESKMADATYQYPFDYTGAATTNKVVGEKHILTRNNYSDFHYIIPKFAPYFEHSLVMTFVGTDGTRRTLVEGIDWYCTHKFKEASLSTAHPIYGSVTFLNNNLAGVVTIGYQTLGGKWTIDTKAIQDILAADIQNPRTTYWEEIVNLPERFPVTNHDFNIIDFTGMSDVRDSLTKIEQAIRTSKGTVGVDHVDRRDNPHDVTKEQVQLGNVLNLPILPATMGANNTNNYYMTPIGVRSIIDYYVKEAFNAHIADRNNPHGTTPALIGTLTTAQINTLLNGKLNNNATAYNTHRFNDLSPEDFKSFVLEGTAKDSERIDGRSYQQLVADIISSVNASTSSGGLTENEVINVMSNNTAANAVTWNSRTESQYATWLNDNAVLNATTLEQKTLAEITDLVKNEVLGSGVALATDLVPITDHLTVVDDKLQALMDSDIATAVITDSLTQTLTELVVTVTDSNVEQNDRLITLESSVSTSSVVISDMQIKVAALETTMTNIDTVVDDKVALATGTIETSIDGLNNAVNALKRPQVWTPATLEVDVADPTRHILVIWPDNKKRLSVDATALVAGDKIVINIDPGYTDYDPIEIDNIRSSIVFKVSDTIEVTTDDNTVLVITNIDPISNVYNIETGLSVLRIERVIDPETSTGVWLLTE